MEEEIRQIKGRVNSRKVKGPALIERIVSTHKVGEEVIIELENGEYKTKWKLNGLTRHALIFLTM